MYKKNEGGSENISCPLSNSLKTRHSRPNSQTAATHATLEHSLTTTPRDLLVRNRLCGIESKALKVE